MANILDVLEEWGCNIDEGLARLGDDEAFYETLLAGFVRDYMNTVYPWCGEGCF